MHEVDLATFQAVWSTLWLLAVINTSAKWAPPLTFSLSLSFWAKKGGTTQRNIDMKDGNQTVSWRQKWGRGGVKTLNNITTEGNHRLKWRLWWGSQSTMVRVTTTSTQRKLCTLVLQGAQMANNCFQQKHGQNKTSQSRRRAGAEPTFLQTIKRRAACANIGKFLRLPPHSRQRCRTPLSSQQLWHFSL